MATSVPHLERVIHELRDHPPQLAVPSPVGLDRPGRPEDLVEPNEPRAWSAGFAIRDFREQAAEVTGDVDHYVAVLAEDLKSPEQYRKITHALMTADRATEAMAWARRGLAHHPGHPNTDRLRDLLVDLRVGLTDEAWSIAVTNPHHVGPSLLQSLVEQRETTHPADVLTTTSS